MKLSRLQFIVAAVFAVVLSSPVIAGDIKGEIESLEKKWSAALAANDAAALGTMLSDDWVNVSSDGSIQTKAAFLEAMKSGELKFTSCKLDNVKVRVYGDTAVVVGEDSSKGTEGGEAFDDTEVFTDVWVKKGEQWLCVSTHSSVAGAE